MNKVLLVGNYPIVDIALTVVLKEQFGKLTIDIVTTLGEMQDALKISEYDIAIIGVSFKTVFELEIVGKIISNNKVRVLVLYDYSQVVSMSQLYRVGVCGIIDKNSDIEEFKKALQNVSVGNIYMNHEFFVTQLTKKKVDFKKQRALSFKESIVANLLVKGQTNKEICKLLSLKPSTVSSFKSKIYAKLEVTNLLELKKIKLPVLKNNRSRKM